MVDTNPKTPATPEHPSGCSCILAAILAVPLFTLTGIMVWAIFNPYPRPTVYVPASAYREPSPLDDFTPRDVVELIGKPGEKTVKFHLAPRRGHASIPTPVPVKAELLGIDRESQLPIEARILTGPNKGMEVDVRPEEVRPLHR